MCPVNRGRILAARTNQGNPYLYFCPRVIVHIIQVQVYIATHPWKAQQHLCPTSVVRPMHAENEDTAKRRTFQALNPSVQQYKSTFCSHQDSNNLPYLQSLTPILTSCSSTCHKGPTVLIFSPAPLHFILFLRTCNTPFLHSSHCKRPKAMPNTCSKEHTSRVRGSDAVASRSIGSFCKAQ